MDYQELSRARCRWWWRGETLAAESLAPAASLASLWRWRVWLSSRIYVPRVLRMLSESGEWASISPSSSSLVGASLGALLSVSSAASSFSMGGSGLLTSISFVNDWPLADNKGSGRSRVTFLVPSLLITGASSSCSPSTSSASLGGGILKLP